MPTLAAERLGRLAESAPPAPQSPGTISAVPMATPPFATAGRAQFFADIAVEPDGFRKHEAAAAAQAPAVD
jgi:hypothetical protein